jgi:3-oxoacyl-(acyl-carrier-protein) synthase
MVRTEPKTTTIDSRQVTAALHATGSSDPDVLFARKEELLDRTRKMIVTATASIVGGLAMSLTLVGAIIGIPVIRRGLVMRKCATENAKTVESAYLEYVAEAARRQTKYRCRSED